MYTIDRKELIGCKAILQKDFFATHVDFSDPKNPEMSIYKMKAGCVCEIVGFVECDRQTAAVVHFIQSEKTWVNSARHMSMNISWDLLDLHPGIALTEVQEHIHYEKIK